MSKDFQTCHQEQVKSGFLSVCALSQVFSSLWLSPSLQNWTRSIPSSTFICLGSTSSNFLRCRVALFGSIMQFERLLTTANSINMWPFFGHKLKYRKLHWNIRKPFFYCVVDSTLEDGAQRGCVISILVDTHNSTGHYPVPADPAVSEEAELVIWSPEAPSTSAVLGFYAHRIQENLVTVFRSLWWSLSIPVKALPHSWCWSWGLRCS